MAGAPSSSYTDEDDAPIADINVTPLVDIVLVLLIVFMITVPTIVASDLLQERDLKIKLPRASEAMPLTFRPMDLIVNVNADGQFSVNAKVLSEEELKATVEQAQADNPDRVNVKIRADRLCPWQAVVRVMNVCNAAGIRSYSASTLE